MLESQTAESPDRKGGHPLTGGPEGQDVVSTSAPVRGLKPYLAYKASGIQWLGRIPAHWGLVPNKAILKRRKVLVGDKFPEFTLLSLTKQGVIVRDVSTGRGKFSADMSTFQEVRPGDLVFCLFDVPETPRTVGLSRLGGMITGAYTVFECEDPLLVRFLETFYVAMDDRKLLSPLYSGLRNTIPLSRFLGIKTAIPPPAEQVAIARFLDWMNERVRRLVEAKERMVGLLEELKASTMSEAVTGKIDIRTNQPYPVNKPSGIGWLGLIPAHWKVRRLGHVGDIRVSNVDKHSRDDEVPVLLCNYVDVYKNDRITRGMPLMAATARPEEIDRFRVGAGDVLLTKDSETWDDIGVPALVEDCEENVVLGYHLALVRPDHKVVEPGFVLRALQSAEVAHQFHVKTRGVTRYGLTNFGMRSVYLPFPPLAEQIQIAQYLDVETSRINTAVANTRQEIELLHEFRARMISDVVTGKVDVGKAVCPSEETVA